MGALLQISGMEFAKKDDRGNLQPPPRPLLHAYGFGFGWGNIGEETRWIPHLGDGESALIQSILELTLLHTRVQYSLCQSYD